MTDKEIIIEGLKKNKETYGKPYCPCKPSWLYASNDAEDYICPCRAYREEKVCCCGLY